MRACETEGGRAPKIQNALYNDDGNNDEGDTDVDINIDDTRYCTQRLSEPHKYQYGKHVKKKTTTTNIHIIIIIKTDQYGLNACNIVCI